MRRTPLLLLATILTSITGGLVWSGTDGTRTQTKAIETEAEVRNLVRGPSGSAKAGDKHLILSEKLAFQPADPALGPLEKAVLDVDIHIEQGFSGMVGDAGPLEEAPERVSIEAGLSTRIEIVGPDGSHVFSTVLPSATVRCAARGSCTFAHHERRPLTMRFEPPASAFESDAPVALILRATTTGGVLGQVCKQAETWERCQIRQARIGITVPKDGIKLTYFHEGAMAPAAIASEGGTLPVSGIAVLTAGIALFGAAGLVFMRRITNRSRAAAS